MCAECLDQNRKIKQQRKGDAAKGAEAVKKITQQQAEAKLLELVLLPGSKKNCPLDCKKL